MLEVTGKTCPGAIFQMSQNESIDYGQSNLSQILYSRNSGFEMEKVLSRKAGFLHTP